MTAACVLVVDDNRRMTDGIVMRLGGAGLTAQGAYSAESALRLLETREFELVLSAIRMPGKTGLDLLESIRMRWPLTKVVLFAARGSIESAVNAMRAGACDYLTKPFASDELVRVVRRAIEEGTAAGGFNVATVVGGIAAAVSADDPLPGLRKSLDLLMRATGADDGEIFLCEPEGRDALLWVCAGPDEDALTARVRFELGVGYPGIVVATGRPLATKGTLAADRRYLRRAVTDAGIRSLVAVPLSDARGVLGSVHLMSRRDDFAVEHALDLLERAMIPIGHAVQAWLAGLRQSVDRVSGTLTNSATEPPLREFLESMRLVAGARYGTLALFDPETSRPDRVVSTGPASLICGCVEAGSWAKCQTVVAAHGFMANAGRRLWPEACRCGLPPRAASPCCLPLVASGRLHGLVVLDFGREGAGDATGRLLPLLTMSHQVAIRLQSHRPGLAIVPNRDAGGAAVTTRAVPELELRCLGPFTVCRRGQPIPAEAFTRRKAVTLLKLLALQEGAPVSREVLIEHLWPEVEPQLGANRLHGIVHDLRSVIEPHRTEREWLYVRNRGELYYLDRQASIDLDLTRFRLLLAQGSRAGPAHDTETIACLEQAVELYRGDLFEDDPFAEWCGTQRQELKEHHVNTLERLARLHTKQGNPERALACLRHALRSSPFRDDLLLAQMELLARLARSNEALAVYDDYVRLLKEDLGVGPSAGVEVFQQRLLRSALT